MVLLYSSTANFFYRAGADPCKTGGKCGRLGKIDGLRSTPKNLQSDWFCTLLQSQSFGARIATEIKNWYSSQVSPAYVHIRPGLPVERCEKSYQTCVPRMGMSWDMTCGFRGMRFLRVYVAAECMGHLQSYGEEICLGRHGVPVLLTVSPLAVLASNPQQTMANWHYYNGNREKMGPVTGRELKQLVQQGMVTPETFVEDPTGRTGLAKDVKGLKFPDPTLATPNPFTATPPVSENLSTIAVPLPEDHSIPVPPPAPQQVFCTNCGNQVSEQAVACMSCGAKPTGHKKFCRHCGVALNPEQVICIQCKSEIGTDNLAATLMAGMKRALPPDAAASLMTGVNRMIPPNVAASLPEKIKKLPKPAIIAGVAVLTGCLFLFAIGNVWQRESIPTLTAVEQAEVDKFIAEHGRDAILHYLSEIIRRSMERGERGIIDEKLVLKYVRYFVSQGADVNAKCDNGLMTPLLCATRLGNVEIAQFLISRGADVNAKNNGGWTPLHSAARGGNVEMVKFLISKGADVNAKLDKDPTPLHVAVSNGNVEIVQFLISRGADVNAKNNGGWTPLHWAVSGGGNVEIAKFLASKGADINARARDTSVVGAREVTPLDMAEQRSNTEMVKYLESVGAKSARHITPNVPTTPRTRTPSSGSGMMGGAMGGGGRMGGGGGMGGSSDY